MQHESCDANSDIAKNHSTVDSTDSLSLADLAGEQQAFSASSVSDDDESTFLMELFPVPPPTSPGESSTLVVLDAGSSWAPVKGYTFDDVNCFNDIANQLAAYATEVGFTFSIQRSKWYNS